MKRRAIELGGYNLGGYSYKSDVFKKPSISHAIPSDHTGTTADLPLFEPTTSRSQNIGHSNTATRLWAQHLAYEHSNLAIGVRTRE